MPSAKVSAPSPSKAPSRNCTEPNTLQGTTEMGMLPMSTIHIFMHCLSPFL